MKYCEKCGTELTDDARFCTYCGHKIDSKGMSNYSYSPYNEDISTANPTMITLSKVFMVLGSIVMGFMIIPLVWCVPMTIHYWRKVDNGENVSLTFKICTLLFCSFLGGIFMIFDHTN